MGPFWKKSVSGSTSAFAAGEKHLSGFGVNQDLARFRRTDSRT
jgi:hypothetical protein